jgi:putative phage-type endonuclease
VLDLEQGTEEWLDWRHSGIGASEASTVMGDNRFQSSSELLYQKRNKINTEPNEKMRLGTSLEQDARDLYIEETGMPVEPLCLQSKEHSWLIASMDGITDDYGHIVEIKCGKSAYWQANKGKVPSYYYGQLQHQLMITGLDSVDYWCYWPGYKGILQTVTRDKPYTRRLLQAEMEFMEQLDE